MPVGWIRAYMDELDQYGYSDARRSDRNSRALFRSSFSTPIRQTADAAGDIIADLPWGAEVELVTGIGDGEWTGVTFEGRHGFVRSAHVVEIAYVSARFKTTLHYTVKGKTRRVTLLWGDCVQILTRSGKECQVRARGRFGLVPAADLSSTALLEVYFIDVGQGDGVLIRTPDRRHIAVDGGLERKRQQTGKNAADFIDWKFFYDYGDVQIHLHSMMASHSDIDHYGGLHDLLKTTPLAERELDCLSVSIDTFHHPGLSRWENRPAAHPQHKDGLGPCLDTADGNYFFRLLEDRADAEGTVVNGADDELSSYWKSFVKAVLNNQTDTAVERLGVARETLHSGGVLPRLWDDTPGYDIRVLAPVTVEINGQPALPDLGAKSHNTNGHSICLRLDIGNASILLTGDLNKQSMDYLMACYGDRMGAWTCDVAKACHHGSDKISYRFLETLRPAATVISSGDAEGHGHPRPEIVGASAVTGRVEIDREADKLVTPLIYMTEIERSVSLGALDRIDLAGVPDGSGGLSDLVVAGRHVDAINDDALLSDAESKLVHDSPSSDRSKLRRDLRAQTRDNFRNQAEALDEGTMTATYHTTVAEGAVKLGYQSKQTFTSRVMMKNHYGLVNVRTDGTTVMCATLDEAGEDWIIHTFPARARV